LFAQCLQGFRDMGREIPLRIDGLAWFAPIRARASGFFLPSLIVAALLTLAPFAAAESMISGGVSRQYKIFRRGGAAGALPAVLLLHGGGGTAAQLERFTDFNRVAASAGIVAVYPQGLGREWNDHRGPGVQSQADDEQFLLDLIDWLAAKGLVDPAQVYIAGISNGGLMALDMACGHADRIAGIAVVAASFPVGYRCNPARPLPVIFVHGTQDQFIPFEGGRIAGQFSAERGNVVSAEETIDFFVRAADCRTRDQQVLPEPSPPDGTHVTIFRYGGCQAGGAVESVIVEGGGHSWPGARQGFLLDHLLGPASHAVDTSAELWRFFADAAHAP
jgi:polyhydroxybutyrate depolymerase